MNIKRDLSVVCPFDKQCGKTPIFTIASWQNCLDEFPIHTKVKSLFANVKKMHNSNSIKYFFSQVSLTTFLKVWLVFCYRENGVKAYRINKCKFFCSALLQRNAKSRRRRFYSDNHQWLLKYGSVCMAKKCCI